MPTSSASRLPLPAMLPPAVRNRLVGILGRLGSDFHGERAAAALLATRLLRERGLSWDELLPSQGAPPAGPTHASADLDLCQRRWDDLSPWLRSFVIGVSCRRKPLSPAQRQKLAEAAAALRGRGLT